MADQDFSELLASLKAIPFGNDRLGVVRDACRRAYFTTGQVREVVRVFTFGHEKVEAAATMYPRTLDKGVFFKVNGDLEYESDREALRVRLEKWDRAGMQPAGDDPD